MAKSGITKVQTMDWHIKRKATGNPKEFARRLGISERSLYEYLNLMKELGAPINYCYIRQSYYYECEGNLIIRFQPRYV